MCRCCASCWEEIYWTCIEEKFCYDESIANYNPDEDEYIVNKNKTTVSNIQQIDNNNIPICNQPSSRQYALSPKIHEEDYRREIQTSVPILAPEILSVFANSQIFQEHQPKGPRNVNKSYLAGVHGKDKDFDQEKLIKNLEDCIGNDGEQNRKIKFTIAPESPPLQLKRSLSPKKFSIIPEDDEDEKNEVILRPMPLKSIIATHRDRKEPKPLRSVQSAPYFSRPASENDIFSITGTRGKISMTPEIPSISYSILPKNYEDTPTIEKYKESISLYSIQTANEAKATEVDYTMPRYFRNSGLIAQSDDGLSMEIKHEAPKKHEKSKRLKHLRDSLPPLRIHSMRHKSKEDWKKD